MKKEEQKEVLFSNMNDKQMKSLLLELANTSYWQAILRFNRIKDAQAINSLASSDPFKDPTSLARTQGVRMGMYYIEQEIMRIVKEVKDEEVKTKTKVKE